MRNFYQHHQSQTNATPNGFQFSPANRSSNLTSSQSNYQTSINSYIDSVSSAVAIASKGANKKPDAPVTKPIVTSPNRPQPPPKQNRLTKKLLALNSSLNNSSVLSSNPVYLDMSNNNNNSNHSSLEFKTNYENDLVIEPSSSSSTSSTHHVNSTGSSSPSNMAFEDNDMDYQTNFTSNATADKFLNPTKMLHQMKVKNSSSTSDLLVKIKICNQLNLRKILI